MIKLMMCNSSMNQLRGPYCLLCLVLKLWTNVNQVIADQQEYCQTDSFQAKCQPNEVIIITSAVYGRMRSGRCIGAGYLGCQTDVSSYLHAACTGQSQCDFPVVKLAEVVQPCSRDYVPYLDATYACSKVSVGDPLLCMSHGRMELSANQKGILASVSYQQNSGIKQCPWLISSQRGQRVELNITMYSYKQRGGSTTGCPYSVIIEDGQSQRNLPVCAFGRRSEVLYTSIGEETLVYFLFAGPVQDIPVFLIDYRAVGCPDVTDPSLAVQRSGSDMTVKCNHTKETWFVTCKGDTWVGDFGNCSTGGGRMLKSGHVLSADVPLTEGLFAAVALGVVLGVILGFTSLSVYIIRRRRKERAEQFSRPVSKAMFDDAYECDRSASDIGYNPHTSQNTSTVHRQHIYESPALLTGTVALAGCQHVEAQPPRLEQDFIRILR